MEVIKKSIKELPNLADVRCDDVLQVNQFVIKPNVAANMEFNPSHYSFLEEIVEIDGVLHKIGSIIYEEGFTNLQELEDYLAPKGFHISWVYEFG